MSFPAITLLFLASSSLGAAFVRPASVPAVELDVPTALIRAGLDAEALAAAGVSSGSAGAVVSDFETSDAAGSGDLEAADASYDVAKADVDRLSRIVGSGQATQEEIDDLAAAKTALASAQADQEAALNALFDAGTASLSADAKATLAAIRGNRGWKVPVQFLTVDRSEAQWVQLRKYLGHEKVAGEQGTAVHGEISTALASWRSHEDVSAAKTSLDSNLSTVQTAWEDAASGE